MVRISKSFIAQKRKDSRTFILTRTVTSGLSRAVFQSWKGRGFIHYPGFRVFNRRRPATPNRYRIRN